MFPLQNKIPEKDNGKSRGLRRAVQLMEAEGKRTRKLFIIRERDALEPWMKKFLVEVCFSLFTITNNNVLGQSQSNFDVICGLLVSCP